MLVKTCSHAVLAARISAVASLTLVLALVVSGDVSGATTTWSYASPLSVQPFQTADGVVTVAQALLRDSCDLQARLTRRHGVDRPYPFHYDFKVERESGVMCAEHTTTVLVSHLEKGTSSSVVVRSQVTPTPIDTTYGVLPAPTRGSCNTNVPACRLARASLIGAYATSSGVLTVAAVHVTLVCERAFFVPERSGGFHYDLDIQRTLPGNVLCVTRPRDEIVAIFESGQAARVSVRTVDDTNPPKSITVVPVPTP